MYACHACLNDYGVLYHYLFGGGGGRGGAVVCINMNLPLSKDDGKIGTLVHSSGLFFVVVFVGVGLPCLSQ